MARDEIEALRRDLEHRAAALAAANAELVRSVARMRAVIESAFDGIVLLGLDWTIERLNASAEKMFGWSQAEVAGRSFLDEFISPRSRSAFARSQDGAARRARTWDLRGRRRDGQEFPIECNVTPLQMGSPGMCAFVRDLTEVQRLEMELQQAQKLEAVGRLASGIAHEINTPIQFIGDNAQFLAQAFSGLSVLLQRYSELLLSVKAPPSISG